MQLQSSLLTKTAPLARKENILFFKNYRITVISDRLFRLEYSADRRFNDFATQSVLFRDLGRTDYTIEEKNGELFLRTQACTLIVRECPDLCTVELEGKQIALDNRENLLGTARTLDMTSDGKVYVDRGDGGNWIRFDSPELLEKGVASKNGVAVLDDSQSYLLKEDGMLAARESEETDLYIFAFGRNYREAVKALFSICGASPMLPRCVFGNWWSRYHAYTEQEYETLIEEFERRNISLSVAAVDMDWHYVDLAEKFGVKEENGWTGFSWNERLFPDHKRFLQWMHRHGLYVTLNLHPADGIRWFETAYPAVCDSMGVDASTGQKIAFDFSDPAFINAYFKIVLKPYEDDGVNFWWIDWQQGKYKEGINGRFDALWALNHYHYLYAAKKKVRPLILSRYAGIGSHRYPLGFSGDTTMTWEVLSYMPYFTATAANAGYFFWSHDIGGHHFGEKDDELYVRWMEFAVFNPVLRLHSSNAAFMGKEPWNYSAGIEAIAAELLRKRQELLPYLYSLCARAHFDGRALLEPIYYEYPYDEEAYNAPQEYFFGDLLVAPVTERTDAQTGLAMREIWLPEGDWLELSSDLIYRGGRYIRLFRYLEEIPVFMPKGCIFVTGTENLLNVTVFGADAEYELYEDDGETTDYQDGIFNDTKFSVHREGNTIEMLVASGKHTELLPKTRTYRFLFRSISRAVVSAQIGETECEVQTEKKEDGLLIQVTDADSDAEIRIILRDIQDISDGERMKKRALKMFGRLNGNNVKIMEWFHVFDSDFDGSDITKFLEMGMPPRFADALSELKQAGS